MSSNGIVRVDGLSRSLWASACKDRTGSDDRTEHSLGSRGSAGSPGGGKLSLYTATDYPCETRNLRTPAAICENSWLEIIT